MRYVSRPAATRRELVMQFMLDKLCCHVAIVIKHQQRYIPLDLRRVTLDSTAAPVEIV